MRVTTEELKSNRDRLLGIIRDQGMDAFYISSFDRFLNEYTPLSDSQRYALTGFSGSTAEAWMDADGRIRLYVDGRYHEQADKEVKVEWVDVIKCSLSVSLSEELIKDVKNSKCGVLGLDKERSSVNFQKIFLDNHFELRSINPRDLDFLLEHKNSHVYAPIYHVNESISGASTLEKIKMLNLEEGEAFYVSSLDSLSWLSNCRGFHLPFMSSFLGRGFLTHEKMFLFVPENSSFDESVKNNASLHVSSLEKSKMYDLLKTQTVKTLYYDPAVTSGAEWDFLASIYGEEALKARGGYLHSFQAVKNSVELKNIQESFDRSDKAVFETILHMKKACFAGEKISERDIFSQADASYKKQGARSLSFNTIAALGANSSIIHYGDASSHVFVNGPTLALLDSGAYYESGFATDTTRTFFLADNNASPKTESWQKEIYTLVLKGLMAAQSAIFPENTLGHFVDSLARAPLFAKGYNFNHGTGHGVGINVHESGISFRPRSNAIIKEGQTVSVEPGIYLPGKGGVRLENVVVVEKHPTLNGMLKLSPLVFVGFDHDLIDFSLLTSEEKNYLEWYERECQKRSRSFIYK